MSQSQIETRRFPRWTGAAVALGAAIAGFAAVYVTLRASDNPKPQAPRPAAGAMSAASAPATLPSGPGANPLSQGHMAAFVFKKAPEALPELKFQDGQGRELTLAAFRGKVVLLNLWATWCLPCRKEMPALDRLQGELGSDKFEVVALSVDRTGIAGARRFLDETKVEKLAVYADPSARLTSPLRATGLPTTLLIDADGREVGRLIGPAEWDSAEAVRLIKAVMR
ncbi:MAG: TlpA disulfide reductase family protein [Hyphomicrobiaceae bacterium]|nr:TlpA disulfide reductase family protein [Hyphomicrobiaceae bacterium]